MYYKALGFILFMNLSSVLIYSCCEDNYRVLFDQTEVSFFSYAGETTSQVTDTITTAFSYGLSAELELITLNELGGGLLNSAYATSCDYSVSNSLVRATAIISVDKPIMIGGQEFAAGENLMDLSERFSEDIFTAYVGEHDLGIYFLDPIMANIEFPADDYEFHTYVETTEGDVIERRDRIYISL